MSYITGTILIPDFTDTYVVLLFNVFTSTSTNTDTVHGCTIEIYVTGFAKRGLICAFINSEKFCFEILITVYLENAWCLVYQFLHQSIVIQGNSAGALFDGLLAELPAILDSFFISTTSEYIGVVGRG